MRLFAFTDTHGNKKIISSLIKKIQNSKPDIVICAGDLTNFGRALKKLLNMFEKTNLPLLIIPGNHETSPQLTEACKKTKFAINIHRKIYQFNDYLFFGYGLGGFGKESLEMEKLMPKIKALAKNKMLIIITHQPPYKTKLDKLPSGHAGNKSIRKFIAELKPVLSICGHLHENESKVDKIKSTVIINPGNKGKVIEI
ncbi:metallophosphoesterase family protein [Candidatus Woesearchaeota archaeon]|nr:metallophosphoesterase family protein [Candidatus Woesearchaeota archaeon]